MSGDLLKYKWFTTGVYYWRTFASIVWSVWFSLPIIIGYRLLCSLNIFQPFDWLRGVLQFTVTLRCAVFVVLFYFVIMLAVLLYAKLCTASTIVYKTRLSVMCSLLRPACVMAVCTFALLGSVGNWALAVMTGNGSYKQLWDVTEEGEKVINERLWFLIFLGGYSGICFGVTYFMKKQNHYTFPIIQQKKLFRLKGLRFSSIKEGFFRSLKSLQLFYPFYYLFGSYPRQFMMNLFNLSLRDDHQLTSLYGLMDLSLILQSLLCTAVLFSLWELSLQLFKVFHTEAIEFPVVATFAGEAPRVIVKCLEAKSVPLLQHLGYLDLCQLSLYSKDRRKQVFSLSQSGQPAVWSDICSQCVTLLSTLTTKLGGPDHSKTDPVPAPLPTQPTITSEQFQKGWPEPVPTTTRRIIKTEKAKLWSTTAVPRGIQSVPIKTHQPDPVLEFSKNIYKKVTEFPNKVKEALKRKPFFSYFLAELPDTSLHELFVDAQLHTWAVKALSQLTVLSYHEDQFGVVQRSLPTVISTLVNLSQIVDKHTKGTLAISRPHVRQSSGATLQAIMMTGGRHSLKAALHSALHNIATVFNKELTVFQLSEVQQRYLQTIVGVKNNC